MNIKDLHKNGLILYDCLSGSKAYNLDLPTSDQDQRGIFILPEYSFMTLERDKYVQINDTKNDIIYYELNRFAELLIKQNPNIIELLFIPEDKIISMHPTFKYFIENRNKFLTSNCYNTFGSYAINQIKKARGLNKKIVNPVDKKRKNPLHFCYVINARGKGTFNLMDMIEGTYENEEDQRNFIQRCGLSSVSNAEGIFYVFDPRRTITIPTPQYRGIINDDETSNTLRVSSIPKGEIPSYLIHYNKDGYTQYCKQYKEYWEWVEKRNPHRYETNIEHGGTYDSKNMTHCVRLLKMAIELLRDGEVNVYRKDREELLKIRNGEKSYKEIMKYVNELNDELNEVKKTTKLPDSFNIEALNDVLYRIRKDFY